MAAPWAEHQLKVVIEFQKGSAGTTRVVNLTHRPDVVPPQLYGRVSPQVGTKGNEKRSEAVQQGFWGAWAACTSGRQGTPWSWLATSPGYQQGYATGLHLC